MSFILVTLNFANSSKYYCTFDHSRGDLFQKYIKKVPTPAYITFVTCQSSRYFLFQSCHPARGVEEENLSSL